MKGAHGQDAANRMVNRPKAYDLEVGLEFTSTSSMGDTLLGSERTLSASEQNEDGGGGGGDCHHQPEYSAAARISNDEVPIMPFSSLVSSGAARLDDVSESSASFQTACVEKAGSTSSDNNRSGDDDDEDDESDDSDQDDYINNKYSLTKQSMDNEEKLCLLAAMDESLKEGHPDYCSRRSSDPHGSNHAPKEDHLDYARRRSDQQQAQLPVHHNYNPPPSPSPTPGTNFLSKRTESFRHKHMLQTKTQSARSQYSQRRQAWKDTSNRQCMSHQRRRQQQQQQQDTDSDDDDTLLMMIAKKRAAMGEDDDEDIITHNSNNTHAQQNEKGKQPPELRRGRQMNDPHELQRPGAYSKSPGDAYQRVRSFEKESFIIRGQTGQARMLQDAKQEEMTAAIRDCSPPPLRSRSKSPPPTRHAARKASPSPQRIPRKQRAAARNKVDKSDVKEDSDLDRKPPAKPSLAKRHTTVLCGSNHNLVGGEDLLQRCNTTDSERKNRAKSLPGADCLMADNNSDVTSSTKMAMAAFAPTRFRRSRTRHSSMSTSVRSSLSSRTSLNLTSLARSITLDSNDSLATSASAQMVADIAEQSVTNFVRSFQRESHTAGTASEQIPIAATVVPSEEDLEGLIRSRLEAELQSHLTQELSHFRQNLFQGFIRRGHVQVADPVLEAGDVVDHDDDDDDDDDDGDLGYNASERDHYNRTLLDLFHDEDEEDSEDLSQSDHDQLVALDAALPAATRPTMNARSRRPGDDFRRSIRQSIRMEFGNLEDELDVEAAQVITPTCASATTGLEPTLSSTQDHDDISSTVRPYPKARQTKFQQRRDKQFVFSSRGLLGWVFLVFLLGTLVGAGSSIWAMESMKGD